MANFKNGDAKYVLEKLINYFNNEYIEWDYQKFRPKQRFKQQTPIILTKPTKWVNHPDYGYVIEVDDYLSEDILIIVVLHSFLLTFVYFFYLSTCSLIFGSIGKTDVAI